ncbi:hypothetical protein K474DRAFT_1665185 [Panus rudis PR-1116 ss-1]|nr:hypothetical protein K474DRAFT_1665185 [Panus rudis PR-1116 ss-1]
MIILWPEWAIYDTAPPANWMDAVIGEIEHQRSPIPSYSKTTVRNWNDGADGDVYNHHVPYSRIAASLFGRTDGETYAAIHKEFSTLLKVFGNSKMPYLDPKHSQKDFNDWYNYVFESICDWPNNLFLGPAEGDNRGRDVDVPINPSPALQKRLEDARTTYKNALQLKVDPEDKFDPNVMSKWNRSFDYE